MGVPALFRWLSKRYPKIITQVLEEPPTIVDDVVYPANYAGVNPNGELDNLYLDMNGIVHPCTHPEGKPAPETEDEMMLEVFKYTDRVVSMARPRKVLMLAVDGVAPRAKMNQQRSRRFRAAQDAKTANEAKTQSMAEAEARGQIIDEAIKDKKSWDSNAITPGTPFMDILALSLRYWIAFKLNNDPGWKDLKVIISDATVPGEGEHKIMQFIRSQRSDPTHDPNTSHCIYGLDADLIFLGLATHEPHFKILREDVFGAPPPKHRKPTDFNPLPNQELEEIKKQDSVKPFIWLHVDILREYLEVDLHVPRLPFKYDFERAIDDWIFMCFFIGNDFLPHLPSLDVRDNSIDTLVRLWKNNLSKMKGFMTSDGHVDLQRVQFLMQGLGLEEDGIFRRKRQNEERRIANMQRRKEEQKMKDQYANMLLPQKESEKDTSIAAISKNRGEKGPLQPLEDIPLFTTKGESVGNTHMSTHEMVQKRTLNNLANLANKSVAQQMKFDLLNGKLEELTDADASTPITPTDEDTTSIDATPFDSTSGFNTPIGSKRSATDIAEGAPATKIPAISEDIEPLDNIKLWEPGYRERYYEQKFKVSLDDFEFRQQVVKSYVEGVCWVMLYYYQGCPSWNWYYPYHYAPFAADFSDMKDFSITFGKGTPFRPYEQLMSVLPAASDHNLPPVFRPLMNEPNSEIIDFYPIDFPIDMNGKKMAWQGIALLPFIDEKRLLKAVKEKYPELSEAESSRNQRRKEILMISSQNKLYKQIVDLVFGKNQKLEFKCVESNGLGGSVAKYQNTTNSHLLQNGSVEPNAPITFPLKVGDMPDIVDNQAIAVEYELPYQDQENTGHVHKSMLLMGFRPLEPILNQEDINSVKYRDTRRENPNHFQSRKERDREEEEMKRRNYGNRKLVPAEQLLKPGSYSYYNNHGHGEPIAQTSNYQQGYNNSNNTRYDGGYHQSSYNHNSTFGNGGNQGGYSSNRTGFYDSGSSNPGQQGGNYNQVNYNHRGGYNNNCNNNRNGYDNNSGRGGYNNYRGGYNNRGGYDNNGRGGYNNRGGYNSRGGGYNNSRDGYNSGYSRGGGYGNNDQRGGFSYGR